MQNIRSETNSQKTCLECSKNGAGVFTCNGCQRSFCVEHVTKHRQDAEIQLDRIGLDHDEIHQDLNKEYVSHPFIARIDEWEKESIVQIEQAANLAREKVRKFHYQRNEKLKIEFNRITNELQLARRGNNYCAIELDQWSQQLKDFRNELHTLLQIREINDTNIPPIHLIQMEQIQPITNLDDEVPTFETDCFDTLTAGPLMLSDNHQLATYIGGIFGGYASVRSLKRYSTHTHEMRFRLECKNDNPIFLGIVSASEPFIARTYKSPSVYGWRDINFTVNKDVSIDKSNRKNGKSFQSGDEIVLILYCDQRRLGCLHQRTMSFDTLEIDFRACPLPWQFAVSMVGMNNRIRIL